MVAPASHARTGDVTSSSDSETSDAEQSERGAATRDPPPASASHRPLPDTAWLSDDSEAPPDAPGAAPKDGVPEFYDPDLDDRDADWVSRRRQGRTSDAILSCPGCLTSVCLDCQQHAERDGHYRAMFVRNCRVDYGKTVVPRAVGGRNRGKRRRDQASAPAPSVAPPAELFHPVECELCGTHLGVYEAVEELYHFYSVVASTA